MARAIFTSDTTLYAEAVEAATVNSAGDGAGLNGSIKYQMRLMTKNEETGEALSISDYHVQAIEMGRDVGHSYDDVAGLSTLCQMMYNQGTKLDPVNGTISSAANAVNPFNFLDDRLLEGTSYILKYHMGTDVLWTPACCGGTTYYETINSDGRGRIDQVLGILYNYYKYMEKRDMTLEKYKYLAQAYEAYMPEGTSQDYPCAATLLYLPNYSAQNANIISGKTYELINKNSGKALTISGASSSNGALAVQSTYSASNSQLWELNSMADGSYTLTNKNSGKVLEIGSAKTTNSATANQFTNNGHPCQGWQIASTSDGYYTLTNKNSGKLLEIAGALTTEGATVGQYADNGNACQRWSLVEVIPSGITFKLFNKNSGKALDISDDSSANSAAAIQSTYIGDNSQLWVINGTADGYYTLMNLNSGKLLEIGSALTTDGATANQYTDNSNACQRWKIESAGNGYYILTNKNSGKLLEVGSAKTTDGATVNQYANNGNACQRWSIDIVK